MADRNPRLGRAVTEMLRVLLADLKGRDRPLARRLAHCLKELRLLSEVPSHSIVANDPKGAERAQIPMMGEEVCLFDIWAKKLVTARSDLHLDMVIEEALEDVGAFKKLQERTATRAEAEVVFGGDGASMEAAAAERVCREYESVAPDRAARLEGDPRLTDWVKKVRKNDRRDPDTGLKLSGWRGWDEATRVAEIRGMRKRGWNQERVATELGISTSTLQHGKYWAHAEPRRVAA